MANSNINKNRGLIWMLLISFLSAMVVSVSGVIYTGISTNNNNRQWCELLVPLDNAYSSAPPKTELGRKVAQSIHNLRKSFKC